MNYSEFVQIIDQNVYILKSNRIDKLSYRHHLDCQKQREEKTREKIDILVFYMHD